MLGQTIKSVGGLLNGTLGIVNTGLQASVCGLNSLNQEISEFGHSLTQPMTPAQQVLAQPSLAQQVIGQINQSNGFNQITQNKPQRYSDYQLIKRGNGFVLISDGTDEYQTEVKSEQYDELIDCLKQSKNCVVYFALVNQPKTNVFPVYNGNKIVMNLWSGLENEPEESIRAMALNMIKVITEISM